MRRDRGRSLSYKEGDYGFRRDGTLAAEVDSKIFEHLRIVLRERISGIANVSTHPSFRGRGTVRDSRGYVHYDSSYAPLSRSTRGMSSATYRDREYIVNAE